MNPGINQKPLYVKAVYSQADTHQLGGYNKLVEAEVQRAELADRSASICPNLAYMTLASSLNARLAKIGSESHVGHGFECIWKDY